MGEKSSPNPNPQDPKPTDIRPKTAPLPSLDGRVDVVADRAHGVDRGGRGAAGHDPANAGGGGGGYDRQVIARPYYGGA